MLKYKKRDYPLCAELPIAVNMDVFNAYLAANMHRWQDNYTAHGGLCVNNGEVADSTLGLIEHYHLTGLDFEADDEPTTASFTSFSPKDKLRRNANIHPTMDEYRWHKPLDHYEGTDLMDTLSASFDAPIIRLRMSRMLPGCVVPPHIDYNTTYAVRFIIPISGNSGVVNRFYHRGEEFDYEMEEGKAYFLNVGYKHAVFHNGDDIRYYLLGTLGGQEDIECLRLENTLPK